MDDLLTQPTYEMLGFVPSMDKIEEVMNCIANRKAVGRDELPVELLKLQLDDDTGRISSQKAIVDIWTDGRVP